MLDVALRRGNTGPWWWLTPLYLGLGALALVLQGFFYHRQFPGSVRTGVMHYLLSAIVLIITCCVLGSLAAWPLRFWLE